jgi:hypothetical protein
VSGDLAIALELRATGHHQKERFRGDGQLSNLSSGLSHETRRLLERNLLYFDRSSFNQAIRTGKGAGEEEEEEEEEEGTIPSTGR